MEAPNIEGALPPLPVPDRTMWQYGKQIDHFTADQMRAFAAEAMLKERAAWVENLAKLTADLHAEMHRRIEQERNKWATEGNNRG